MRSIHRHHVLPLPSATPAVSEAVAVIFAGAVFFGTLFVAATVKGIGSSSELEIRPATASATGEQDDPPPSADPEIVTDPALPPWVEVAEDVEPAVREALALALEALPEPLRTVHESLRVDRAESLAVPDDAPLSVRLLGRAALMLYSTSPPTITVFDGAVSGEPSWGQPAPDARSLGEFLNALTDVLGIESGTIGDDGVWDSEWLESAWSAFAARVHRLDPELRRSNRLDPNDRPAPGDPATLDIFLQAGVRIALGGLAPSDANALVGLFVHELGHAIQYGPCMNEHLRRWGELSGWRTGPIATDPRSQRAAGRHAGLLRSEDPIVLIRLILGDRRRGVLYDARCLHCFPTLYGKYDMAEDFAEAVRLMAHDPARLASSSAEKFLFVNAVGFNRTMDHRRPGPLWRDVEEIREARWSPHLVGALTAMLVAEDATPDGPRLGAHTITALVGAHAELLDPDALPPPHEFPAMPTDMPRAIFHDAAREHLAIRIGDVEHIPPPGGVIDLWAQAFLDRRSNAEFEQSLAEFLHTSESVIELYDERVRDETDFEERTHRFLVLLSGLRRHLPTDEYRRLVADEIEHAIDLGRLAAARWIAIESRLDDLEIGGLEIGDQDGVTNDQDTEYERRELALALAHRAVERDEIDLTRGSHSDELKELLKSLAPSDPAGSLRRIELLLALAERTATAQLGSSVEPSNAERADGNEPNAVREIADDPAALEQRRRRIRRGFIESARRELDGITWPRIRREAERLIARAERLQTDAEP